MAKKSKANKDKKVLPISSIDWVDFSDVKLWKDNPRKNEKAVDDLALLLAQHGQRTPLSVWRKDNVIYKGNTTYKALLKLKKMTPAKFKKFTAGIKNPYKPEQVLVAFMRFESKKLAELYGFSDNKSSEWSEWDDTLLAKLTQEYLSDTDKKEAFALTGFKDRELNELLHFTTEFPDELPKVDIEGTADTLKADYCIIEMPDKKTRLQFMETIGVDHFRNRVIKLADIEQYLDSAFIKAMRKHDVGEVTYTPQKKKKDTASKGKKKFKFKRKK